MHFSNALILAIAAAGASAAPLEVRVNQVCGAKPAGPAPQTPLGEPDAPDADACKKLCDANPKCKAFAFGLPPNARVPICKLFAVPGADIPAQSDNVVVYDKACSSVPKDAPAPRDVKDDAKGLKPSTTPHGPKPTGHPPTDGKPPGPKPTGPPPADGKPPGPKPTGPPPADGKPPSPEPTAEPKKDKSTGTAEEQKQPTRRDVCGSKPAGPSGNPPTPLQTPGSIGTAQGCLDLCKKTAGCKSIEFGVFVAHGPNVCKLFNVPVSQLPPPTPEQSIVAFDVGC